MASGRNVSVLATSSYRARAGEPGSRSRSAATLTATTDGSRRPQTAPWGASNRPPIGPANPWAAPRPALASASPPSRAAMDMSSRASGAAVPAPAESNATRRDRATRVMPSRQNASVNGLARDDVNGSTSWTSASSPELAVTAGGSVYVRLGSTRATRASIDGLRRLTLTRCRGEARTAFRVTSLPVPAVVGIAIHGTEGRSSGRPAPMTSRWSNSSPPLPSMAAIALAPSIALPPPNPTTTSDPAASASATPSRTTSTVGSPRTVTTSCRSPAASSRSTTGAARSADVPVTRRTRDPNAAARSPACSSVPGPNTMREAVANSNCTSRG